MPTGLDAIVADDVLPNPTRVQAHRDAFPVQCWRTVIGWVAASPLVTLIRKHPSGATS